MTLCVITIPIYKEVLTPNEQISLERVCQINQDNQIVILAPEKLLLTKQRKLLQKSAFSVKYFNKKYFSSIEGYNQLLLSPFFYKTFLEYQYLLVYQLDAFILQNTINEWCEKDYDFIGAPWFNNEKASKFYLKMSTSSNPIVRYIKKKFDYNKGKKIYVGNGGLSLRKVKSFYKISKWLPFIEPNIFKYRINEDFVWSILVTKYFKNFKIPPFEEALRFSIEENPKASLELLKGELPFGCHAWEKYDIDVWRPIFSKFGYKI